MGAARFSAVDITFDKAAHSAPIELWRDGGGKAVAQWNSWFDTVMYIRGNAWDTLSSLLAHMLMEQQTNFINDMKLAKRAVSLTIKLLQGKSTLFLCLFNHLP